MPAPGADLARATVTRVSFARRAVVVDVVGKNGSSIQ